jgi:hypothetical protein
MTDENVQRLLDVDARYARYLERKSPPPPPRKARGLLQRDRILALLDRDARAALTSSEIDERLGLPASAASKVMTHLVREGKVSYHDGRYQLTPPNPR